MDFYEVFYVMIDIGGGFMELILVDCWDVWFLSSIKVGVVWFI